MMVPNTTSVEASDSEQDAMTASLGFGSLGSARAVFEEEVPIKRTKTQDRMRTRPLNAGQPG